MRFDNKLRATVLVCALAVSSSAVLIGCGGGGGSSGASGTSFSGTIASGAAYPKGTTITAYDKNGLVIGTPVQTTDDTGNYSYVIPAGAQAPFVFAASAPNLDTLYSFSATGTAGVVNITPITNLIAARLATNGNPENLVVNTTNPTPDTSKITATNVLAQTQNVATVLAPLSGIADPTLNPFTTPFTANGSGYDQLLDALKIKITPVSGGANVDIAVESTSSTPIVIPTFPASTTTTATIPSLQQNGVTVTGTIAANTLVASGTAMKVKDLVTRIQACFSIPLAERVVANSTNAAGIIHSACRTLFSGDDPANYKHNGFPVGVYANGNHWTGILKSTETGRVWDLAKYEYTIANGDIAISWRSKSADGSDVRFSTMITRLEGTAPNQQLKVIGNQYNYDADIGPQAHKRTFVNDLTYNYRSTGYRIYVENKQSNGSAIFDRVVVSSPATPTHPQGVTFTLKPSAGLSYLALVKSNGGLTNAGTVMLNLTSIGGANKATIIANTPDDYLWANPADWSDANISAIAQQTSWTFKYYFADNSPPVEEVRRTTQRAPTLAELASQTFVEYTSSMLSQTTAATSTNNYFIFNSQTSPNMLIDFSADGDLPAWQVPTGALAPRELGVWGRAPYINNGQGVNIANRFNDTANVSMTARKGFVYCNRQSNADLHCQSNAVVGTPTTYATGTILSYFSLQSFGQNNLRINSGLALYKPSLYQPPVSP